MASKAARGIDHEEAVVCVGDVLLRHQDVLQVQGAEGRRPRQVGLERQQGAVTGRKGHTAHGDGRSGLGMLGFDLSTAEHAQ